jgi:hypothetical protein
MTNVCKTRQAKQVRAEVQKGPGMRLDGSACRCLQESRGQRVEFTHPPTHRVQLTLTVTHRWPAPSDTPQDV